MSPGKDLELIRAALEEIDRLILAKLKERMALVDQIAEAKLEQAYPFRDRGRQEQVLQKMRHLAVELELDPHGIEQLYRCIMEMSVARQQTVVGAREIPPFRVSYQGVEGSHTHLAAQRRYVGLAGGVLLTGYETLCEAVDAVSDGSADAAFLPIDSAMAGSIDETYDLIIERGVRITAEEVSHIESESRGYTRFVEVTREAVPVPPNVPCKISLLLHLSNRSGALDRVLAEMTRPGVEITKVESRPFPGSPSEHRVYIDIESQSGSEEIAAALAAIEAHVEGMRILGTYGMAGYA